MKDELISIREQKHEVGVTKRRQQKHRRSVACLEAQLEERDALIERARMESSSHADANERVKELEAKLTEVSLNSSRFARLSPVHRKAELENQNS